jgi:hypothetical protein
VETFGFRKEFDLLTIWGLLMRLDRRERFPRDLQVTVVGCSDDLCSPHHGAKEYLALHGVVGEIPDANIHKIRNMGGIFTAQVFQDNAEDIRIVTEHLFKQIGGSITLKKSSIVFVCGHNPCMGCNTISVTAKTQKQRLLAFAKRVHEQFSVSAVALFEEHAHSNHYDVLGTFGSCDHAIQVVDVA